MAYALGVGMRRLVCSLALVLAARTAHAEPRCIGGAAPGAVVGAVAVPIAVLGSLKISGYDLQHSQHVDAIGGGGMIAGAVVGPIASCAAFSDEPHLVPAASLVVGGAIVGGLAAGGLTCAALHPQMGGCPPGRSCGADFGEAVTLSTLALAAGAVAGGFGGYYLHVHAFGSDTVVAPGVASLVVAGRF
jgi:hypothetical protein